MGVMPRAGVVSCNRERGVVAARRASGVTDPGYNGGFPSQAGA